MLIMGQFVQYCPGEYVDNGSICTVLSRRICWQWVSLYSISQDNLMTCLTSQFRSKSPPKICFKALYNLQLMLIWRPHETPLDDSSVCGYLSLPGAWPASLIPSPLLAELEQTQNHCDNSCAKCDSFFLYFNITVLH